MRRLLPRLLRAGDRRPPDERLTRADEPEERLGAGRADRLLLGRDARGAERVDRRGADRAELRDGVRARAEALFRLGRARRWRRGADDREEADGRADRDVAEPERVADERDDRRAAGWSRLFARAVRRPAVELALRVSERRAAGVARRLAADPLRWALLLGERRAEEAAAGVRPFDGLRRAELAARSAGAGVLAGADRAPRVACPA